MTGKPPEAARILGTLGAAGGVGSVRMRDRVDIGIDRVWSALTDPRRLAGWLGEVEGDLRPGGNFRARFFASGWEGTGRVEACEPPHRLMVVTTHTNHSEEHAIEVILTSDGEATLLVAEERGMPLHQLAAYGAGVQIHVEDLAAHLAGREIERDAEASNARWEVLLPAYEALAVDAGE